MRFKGDISRFSIAFCRVNDTVDAVAQPLREPEIVPVSIGLRVLGQNLVHD